MKKARKVADRQKANNQGKMDKEKTESLPDNRTPCFTSVDPRPPEFPPENNDKEVRRWEGRLFNIRQLLQMLIDMDNYFQKEKIPLNQKSFEQNCPRLFSPIRYSTLVLLKIVHCTPFSTVHTLNPLIRRTRFLVLNDVEWSVFENVSTPGQIRIDQLAKLTDFKDGGEWDAFKRQSALWNIILSKKLHGVFVIETVPRGDNIEIWIRLNRCLQKENVVQRIFRNE